MRITAHAAVYDSFEGKPYQKLGEAVRTDSGVVVTPFLIDGEQYWVALNLCVAAEPSPPVPSMTFSSGT